MLQVPDSMNISIGGKYSRQGTGRESFQGIGEQVFAIQRRVVKLRPASILPWSTRREDRVEGKELKVVDFDNGVFSPEVQQRPGGQKITSGAKSKTAPDSRQVELSTEDDEVDAEAKRRGLTLFCIPDGEGEGEEGVPNIESGSGAERSGGEAGL